MREVSTISKGKESANMKKIMNKPEDFVKDTLSGLYAAYSDQLMPCDGETTIVLSKHVNENRKVGIVTAGGSGHLPLFLGYVGSGMLNGCTVGNVFASPSAQKMEAMIRACDSGAGVLCLFGNYGGDRMNFELARETVEFDDIQTTQVLGRDDVASSPKAQADKRRGVAGIIYAYKIAGAAADSGLDLEAVTSIAQRAVDSVRTLGFATGACILPEVGTSGFHIAQDEIEVGMGIHGEPGIEVRKMMTAREIAVESVERIDADMPLVKGDVVSVMVNGLGATPMEELLIVYGEVHKILTDKGITLCRPHVGEYATSMEMAGLSVSIIKLDEEMKALLEEPARTPFYINQ